MKGNTAKEWTETIMAGFPNRLPEFESVVKNSTAFNEKLAETAFHAMEDSVKLSAEWTKEAIADLEKMTKTQQEPVELATTIANYTSDAASKSTQKVAALAEIMGKMQAETIRLFVEASKNTMETKPPAATENKPKAKKA